MSWRGYNKAGLGVPSHHQQSALLAHWQCEVIYKGVQKVLTSATAVPTAKKAYWDRTHAYLQARLSRPVLSPYSVPALPWLTVVRK
jgi:hypothetical protein